MATKKIPVRNYRRAAVQTVLLRTLYVGSMLSVALLAPKLTRILPHPNGGKKHRKELYNRIAHARYTLQQRGLIEETDERLQLTEKGEIHIARILLREYKVPEPVRWDGKWRLLMFDIHEKRRRVRSRLRKLLQGAGFVRLQDSVWVYPYPCDEFIGLVRAHLKSGTGEMLSFVAEALESDRHLREHFNLAI